jgi:hypothetical protein
VTRLHTALQEETEKKRLEAGDVLVLLDPAKLADAAKDYLGLAKEILAMPPATHARSLCD